MNKNLKTVLLTLLCAILVSGAVFAAGCGKKNTESAAESEAGSREESTSESSPVKQPDSSAESASSSESSEAGSSAEVSPIDEDKVLPEDAEGYSIPIDDDFGDLVESNPTPGEGFRYEAGEKIDIIDGVSWLESGETAEIPAGPTGAIPYAVGLKSAEITDASGVVQGTVPVTRVLRVVVTYTNRKASGEEAFQISPLLFSLADKNGCALAACTFSEEDELATAHAIPAGETGELAIGFVLDDAVDGPYTLVFDDLINGTDTQAIWMIEKQR